MKETGEGEMEELRAAHELLKENYAKLEVEKVR